MPDRIVRDELLESERWLDLPTDAARLAFVGFLLIADDFGNFEGGPRRLSRFLHTFTQIKTPEAAVATIDALMLCDLIRRYEVDGREFFHIPRFRPHKQYLTRKMPRSPWDGERVLGKNRRVEIRGFAKDQALGEKIVTTSQPRSSDVAEGVGVGVGVGVGEVQVQDLDLRSLKQVRARAREAEPPGGTPEVKGQGHDENSKSTPPSPRNAVNAAKEAKAKAARKANRIG